MGTGLARLNDSGDLLWIKNYDPGGQFARNPYLASTPGNGLVVASGLQSGAGRGFYVVRTNAAGDAAPCCTPSQNLEVLNTPATSTVFVPSVSTGPSLVAGNWVASTITPERTNLCASEMPEFTVSDSTVCPGGCLDLTITNPSPGVNYTWSFSPTGTWTPGNPSRVCFNSDSSKFTIILTANGCVYQQARDSVLSEKRENQFPNAFTPNNDDANDVFMPLLYCPVTDYHFTVYNRWGEIMFETFDPAQGWDGMFNGLEAVVDAYAYVVEFRSAAQGATALIQRKGSVTLLR